MDKASKVVYNTMKNTYIRKEKTNMKIRITSLLMALALTLSASLMTACGGAEDDTTDTGITETEPKPEPVVPEGGVSTVETPEDIVTFIDVNVYSQTPDYMPMMVMTMPLDLSDMDTVTYQTGLTDLTGITDIIWSESGVGSFAYSFLYVRTDGSNTDAIQETLGSSVDPVKWVCVSAEKISTVRLDNDIVLVMGAPDQVDAIMGAVTTAAVGIFDTIGDVVNVMG